MVDNQVIVVTGATRGIGRNTALYFAEKGYQVVGTGRDSEKLKEVQKELEDYSTEHTMVRMDITNPAEVKQVAEDVFKKYGRIDVWVNNAGAFMAIGPTWEVKQEDWVNDVTTNLIGTFHCTQAIIPIMLKQGFGSMINIVGGGTIGAFKYGSGYGTSKTAIARFTENLSEELKETPIQVFALDPGLNDTDMTRYQRYTEVGQSYLIDIESLFEQNIDVPPHQAPQFVYYMAAGELNDYVGRIVSVYEDIETLKNLSKEDIDADFYKLRLKK
ncbi:SDR family oxidoreductase [Bacillus sp. USDA818B3_A]|uniref:SDR family oxidoreductase n=1 Tax=Bacillus sp. USDA818B3_A TaxID=2698834 RepID=UPI00136F06D6|nr:SDR family oxidoreductase [Bacillus sp. USDA818B3_A]